MRSRAVRLVLVILLVLAGGATAYFIWSVESKIRAADVAVRDFDSAVAAASRATLELRSAQQAYVAIGQGDEFWTAKVAAAVPQLVSSIAALAPLAQSAQAQSSIETASGVLRDFEQMDKRAREYTRAGQKLLASDLIFSDGLEMTGEIAAALHAARRAELDEFAWATAQERRAEVIALAACGSFALLVAMLLAPRAGAAVSDELPAPVTVPAAPPIAASRRIEAPAAPVERPPSAKPVNLGSVASVCTELARVADTRELPSLLERTAGVLDASGIILWVADPDGRELTPIMAHGYAPQLLGRLGNLARDAENATAAAFRTGLVQTVNGDSSSNGAIAAPLVTPAGTVGVMAAEIRSEGEPQPAKLAVASIVAAQLATLVGPPARAQSKEMAGG